MRLSAVEKKVLNAIQEVIPFTPRPFEALAGRIGITEQKFIETMQALKDKKILRDYSARLNHRELGFKSTLFGLRVPPDRIAAAVSAIVPFREVTHCFRRDGAYNIWVAFIFRGSRDKDFLRKMTPIIGKGNVINLKTVKKFKLMTRLEV